MRRLIYWKYGMAIAIATACFLSPAASNADEPKDNMIFSHAVFSVAASKCEGNFAEIRDFTRTLINTLHKQIDVETIGQVETLADTKRIAFCELARGMQEEILKNMQEFVAKSKKKK